MIRSPATKNLFTALGGPKPQPEQFMTELGKHFEIIETSIKKWCVGSPLQSVLDCVAELLKDPEVRAGRVKRIVVDMPADRLHIVDNKTIPDICLQHLVALMIVDGGAGFDSVHDFARMTDPKVLAIRKLVRGGAEQGTGDRGAGPPGDRGDRDRRRPQAQPPHLRGARHARQSRWTRARWTPRRST